jgi:hypothetical protein
VLEEPTSRLTEAMSEAGITDEGIPWIGSDDNVLPPVQVPETVYAIGLSSKCGECGEPQYLCPSGISCTNGHGGADSFVEPAIPETDILGTFYKQGTPAEVTVIDDPETRMTAPSIWPHQPLVSPHLTGFTRVCNPEEGTPDQLSEAEPEELIPVEYLTINISLAIPETEIPEQPSGGEHVVVSGDYELEVVGDCKIEQNNPAPLVPLPEVPEVIEDSEVPGDYDIPREPLLGTRVPMTFDDLDLEDVPPSVVEPGPAVIQKTVEEPVVIPKTVEPPPPAVSRTIRTPVPFIYEDDDFS